MLKFYFGRRRAFTHFGTVYDGPELQKVGNFTHRIF
jgi:hypothetical protein